jgi:hypothetical protein
VTLPINDAVVVQLARIADALEQMNEDREQKVVDQVSAIRVAMEHQYRETIDNLEKRLPKHGHTFPFIDGPISGGGIGKAPVGDTDTL